MLDWRDGGSEEIVMMGVGPVELLLILLVGGLFVVGVGALVALAVIASRRP